MNSKCERTNRGVRNSCRVLQFGDTAGVDAKEASIANRHIAKHDGGLGEIDALAELRLLAQKSVELFVEFAHALNLFVPPTPKNKNPLRFCAKMSELG